MENHRNRTLKPNTVVGTGNAQTLQALCYWVTSTAAYEGLSVEEHERIGTAINALGKYIVSEIEAAYAPTEKNYKVMVRVNRTTTSDFPVYVKATDEAGALDAAYKKVGGELNKSGDTATTAEAYDAKECDEDWLQKEGGAE